MCDKALHDSNLIIQVRLSEEAPPPAPEPAPKPPPFVMVPVAQTPAPLTPYVVGGFVAVGAIGLAALLAALWRKQ